MKDFVTIGFPEDFGNSPIDFLKRYEHLIYKVLCEEVGNDPELDIEDMFNDFFIHISEKNFKRLRNYKRKCRPITYLGKILRNFIYDQYRKKGIKKKVFMMSLEEVSERREIPDTETYQEDHLNSLEKSRVICKALKKTFAVLSNLDKLIFTYTYFEGEGERRLDAKEISDLLGVKVRYIYDTNRKVRRIFKEKLKESGITTF